MRGFGASALVLLMLAAPAAAHDGVPSEIARVSERLVRAPRDVALRLERASLYRRARDLEKCGADVKVVEQLDPKARGLFLERGLLRIELGNFGGAEQDLSRYLAGGPAFAAFKARAAARTRLGKLAPARADYDAAIKLAKSPELYLARGEIDERLGKFEQAASGYREGLKATNGALTLRLALIRVERARKHFAAARAEVDELIQQAQLDAEYLLLRADIFEQAGDAARARRDRLQALQETEQLLEKRPTALRRLIRARVLLALGRLDAAEAELQSVVKTAPRLTEARQLLSEIAVRRKK